MIKVLAWLYIVILLTRSSSVMLHLKTVSLRRVCLLRARHRAIGPAVRGILDAWFDHLVENLSYD